MAGYTDYYYMQPADSSASGSSGGLSGPAAAGATGFMAGGPAGAAIAVGGQFLMQHMAQRAADERARRERAAQIEQQYAQNQQGGISTMMRGFEGALR